jgi:hypothetical protein
VVGEGKRRRVGERVGAMRDVEVRARAPDLCEPQEHGSQSGRAAEPNQRSRAAVNATSCPFLSSSTPASLALSRSPCLCKSLLLQTVVQCSPILNPTVSPRLSTQTASMDKRVSIA